MMPTNLPNRADQAAPRGRPCSAETDNAAAGFTLIEILVAIAILMVVTGIVYASFSSVVNSTDIARVAAEEMRLRQLLARSLQQNLSQCYGDWQPGAALRKPIPSAPPTPQQAAEQARQNAQSGYVSDEETVARYWLLGTNDRGPNGPADSLSFTTTAPLIGGKTLPGILKQVTYEVVPDTGGDENLYYIPDDATTYLLEVTETPILETPSEDDPFAARPGADTEALLGGAEYIAKVWSVPVRTFDVQYFDGESWLDEWDSIEWGHLPWALRVRINFARTDTELEAERASGLSIEDDPDFDMTIALPAGMGMTHPPIQDVHRMFADGPQGGRPADFVHGTGETGIQDGRGRAPGSPARRTGPR